ncbi:MAG: histidine phosphotransferase family protein [Alphaproteobacteria bacterium]
MQIDMHVLELLSSKLCHDLVSPVSAINNGVELIEDIGGGVVDEAMKLIGDSAQHASHRLKMFRMAYGRSGSEGGLPVRDVKQVAEQYISGGKVTLNWAEGQLSDSVASQPGYLKVVLNAVILAEEVLPYGGLITLRPTVDSVLTGCRLEIVGRNAQLSPQLAEALDGTAAIQDLTPRSIQAYITGKFAAHFGMKIKYDQSIQDRLDLNLFAAEVMAAA